MKPYVLTLLVILSLTACNSTTPVSSSTDTSPTTTSDQSDAEKAYYDSCPTNPDCEESHVIGDESSAGAITAPVGTLLTSPTDTSKTLMKNAMAYLDDFFTKRAEDLAAFKPEDFPEELKTARDFADAKFLAMDDKYLYTTVNVTTYYKTTEGTVAANGGGANLAYRFEYDPKTLAILDFKDPGEGMEGMDFLFPKEVKSLYEEVTSLAHEGKGWETEQDRANLKTQAEQALL